MSVDKLRGSKHINRISPSDIGLLMSAQSYRPEITQAIRKIKSLKWSTLQKLVENTISPGPHPKYGGCYPCLKTKNVDGLLAIHEPADYADATIFKDIKKVVVRKGDLLINLTGAGSIGRVSIYYGENNPITNQHIARMSVKAGTDEGYLACFLRSWWGERALEQGVAGSTGQINMVNEHVRSIPVYLPDILAQKYIGDKVRQAELLRAWAKSVQVEIKAYFDELMPDLDLKTNVYKAPIDSLGNRLDAIFYLPRYVDLDSYLATKPDKVRSLADYLENKISGPAIPSNQFYSNGSGVLVLQTKDIRENYIDQKTCAKITQENAVDLKRFQVSAGTLLMGMSGTIGRTALLFDEADSFIINQRVAALVLKDVKIAGYLCAYLNHSFGRLQLQRYSVGGVQANIGLSEITSAKILVEDRVYAEKISELFIESLIANKLATALTEAAKVLVESLIEGQLTEQQLIQAQQALEDGDNSLDQAILSKLSAEGYAIEGATPLFSDVDELYSLLEEAAQAEAEE